MSIYRALVAAFMARPLSVVVDPDSGGAVTDPDNPDELVLDPDEEV
jgi:hypothetical protein